MITESDIEWAAAQGACDDAIEWLRESPRSLEDAIEMHPDWLLEHASERLTDAQLATVVAVAANPRTALYYERACARMSDDQFALAIAAEPGVALCYASDRLTDEQFALAVAAEPWTALSHEHVCARMSDAQFALAVAARPWLTA